MGSTPSMERAGGHVQNESFYSQKEWKRKFLRVGCFKARSPFFGEKWGLSGRGGLRSAFLEKAKLPLGQILS